MSKSAFNSFPKFPKWHSPLLIANLIETMNQDDFCKHAAGKWGYQLQNLWNEQQHYNRNKPSLFDALIKMFGISFLLLATLLLLVECGSVTILAISLKFLLNSSSPHLLLLIVVAAIVLKQIGHHYYLAQCARLEMKAQIACCSLVYRKALRGRDADSLQALVKLIRPRFHINHLQVVFVGTVNAALSVWILCHLYDNKHILASLVLFTAITLMQCKIVELLQPVRKKVQRLASRNDKVDLHEKFDALAARTTLKVLMLWWQIIEKKFFLLIGLTFPIDYGVLLASFIIFDSFKDPLLQIGPAFTNWQKNKTFLHKLQSFLAYDKQTHCQQPKRSTLLGEIVIRNGWLECDSITLLHDINFTAKMKQLNVVMGDDSKSSLVHVILGESQLTRGKLQVGQSVSYASKAPWVFPGTVKDNILFAEEWQEEKYRRIVEMCALEGDLSKFNDKLLSEGEVPHELQAKIHLARAMYKNADIYLLDGALDTLTDAKFVFNECLKVYLRKKCVVLITNRLFCMEGASRVHLMQMGTIVACSHDNRKLAREYGGFLATLQTIPVKRNFIRYYRRFSSVQPTSSAPRLCYAYQILLQVLAWQLMQTVSDAPHLISRLIVIVCGMAFSLGYGVEICLFCLEEVSNLQHAFISSRNLTLFAFLVTWVCCTWSTIVTICLFLTLFCMSYSLLPAMNRVRAVQMKKLELLESYLLSTFAGLITIRAFRAQKRMSNEFDRLQDQLASINKLSLSLKLSVNFWVDATLPVLFAFVLNTGTSFQLAITLMFALSHLAKNCLFCDVNK